jgi:excisionase family DNA binding protein
MEAGGGGGAAGTASELAVGFAIAQQIMQQQGGVGGIKPVAGGTGAAAGMAAGMAGAAGAAAAQAPLDLLGPAEVAGLLGVSESDVLAVLESGELKGRKVGSAWRVKRSAVDEYLAG